MDKEEANALEILRSIKSRQNRREFLNYGHTLLRGECNLLKQ